ncbi:MAG: PD-(D/E)XK nuclease family protein [Planctomycetes bacterium]|nr:PD-(D/E)XK nuclease family protein [Planctomycetota bacterium]
MMRRYSYSKISTYLRCPRLYRLRYEDRLEPERLSLALPLGSAMHDCLQWEVAERGRGREVGAGEIHEVFRALLMARLEIAGCPVSGEPEEASETGRRMIEAYIAWGRLQDIATIEGEHLAPIDEGIELEGRIDFVRDGEEVEILELKTAARAWSQSQADLNLQAACYSLLTGIEKVRFIVLTKTKSPKVQEILTSCSWERLDLLRDTIREVDAAIRARSFPRNVSPMNCAGCEFRDQCLGTLACVGAADTDMRHSA